MANAMRFTTAELAELETRIGRAADHALALELAIFDELVAEAMAVATDVAAAGRALADLDVAAALAELAASENYVRPALSDEPRLRHRGRPPSGGRGGAGAAGRLGLRRPTTAISATARRLWLLTGPNMAGKSTFLRQNALIAILAQTGSFVPAKSATIGIVDRLFSRVGAADDLARGRSTFMVEMVETAAILNQATAQSLVILDEIGRGTATFDGLSIAWATLEHLHDVNRCRALFATHYPRAGRAQGAAGRARALHHAGQGMAERGRVPARGGAGRRRPLLRHPCRPARRPAGRRRGARRGGAGGAGEGRAVGRGDAARRRPAAVRRRTGAPGGGVAKQQEFGSREGARRRSIPTSSRRARRWSCSTACASASSLKRSAGLRPAHDSEAGRRPALRLRLARTQPHAGERAVVRLGLLPVGELRKTVARP